MRFETVDKVLASHERERPDATALVVDGRRMTYGQMAGAVRRAAHHLQDDIGLGRGEHMATLMANSLESAVWLLAGATLGCTVAPLNTRLRGEELAYQVRHSDSVVVVTAGERELDALEQAVVRDGALSHELPSLRRVVTLDDADRPWASVHVDDGAEVEAVFERPAPDDVLIIQYTSGTTALPKGVLLTQRQILTNAAGVAQRLGLTERDRVCSPSPFFHVAGTTLLLFLGLVAGATVYSFAAFEPGEVLDTVEREEVTVYNGIETFFIGLLKHPSFAPERLRSIRTGWIAASSELVAQVHQEMGLTGIRNVYGISEASPNVTIADSQASVEERITCGTPHSGTELRIVDLETGRPVAAGASGVIEVRGPCVTQGYYNAPEQTAEVLAADGWFSTGDRGRLDERGNLVYEGRAKDMLRVGGENVAPAEIEAALLAHPDIAEAGVVGVPHDRLVEVPAAFVALHEGQRLSEEEVTAFVAGRLASFKVPHLVRVVERLPMTGSGKVQKYRLSELAREQAALAAGQR